MSNPFQRTILSLLLSIILLPLQADYADLVNPFIGTDYTGNTYPGAQVPFGMVQLSPDNGLPGWDRIAGYFYPDSTIAAFSHTHLSGTGAGDLYDVAFMPVTLPVREAAAPLGVHSRFSHSEEKASAGYYRVRLADYDIVAELTATPRCGIQRYTFPADGRERRVIVNLAKATNWDATLATDVRLVDSATIEGYRHSDGWARGQRVWFRSRFSQPIQSMEIDSVPIGSGRKGVVVMLAFRTDGPRQLVVTTALSGTGANGARLNLEAEAPHYDFDRYLQDARSEWNAALGRIEVEGGTRAQATMFYTALYHAMLAPTLYGDADGRYRGPDGRVHRAHGWDNYSTFSLWDTYRAAHPLYALLCPQRATHMVRSILAFADENGRLPVWNMWASETDMMIGYHAASVVAEAAEKGLLPDSLLPHALDACVRTARLDAYRGIGLYRRMGYVPCDVSEPTLGDNDWSLSRTLEYAYDDWCIARLARRTGRRDVAREFERRARNYRNTFNPATGFFQPRRSDGTLKTPFRPEAYSPHICESNAWHYLWNVQHDPSALIRLMGRRTFEARLDSFFTLSAAGQADLPLFSTGMIGQYAHGNEPSHHVAYLYNFIHRPADTQRRVHEVMRTCYDDTPAGLCGNDDCGQMSAWLVFSAIGFYPVCPPSGRYELGLPLFPRIRLHLDGGSTLVITAATTDPSVRPSRRVLLNGRRLRSHAITHQQILAGGVLAFE